MKINPRDKQANAQYNQLLNEMQDKRISQTIIPRLINDGTPTPAGLFAIVASLLLILAAFQLLQTEDEFEDGEAVMRVTWTDSDGVFHDENITIALHRAEAPIHVENFILHSEDGNYNNVIFHRIISGFMIQEEISLTKRVQEDTLQNGMATATGKWRITPTHVPIKLDHA